MIEKGGVINCTCVSDTVTKINKLEKKDEDGN